MNIGKVLRTTFFYRTHPVAPSVLQSILILRLLHILIYLITDKFLNKLCCDFRKATS